MRYPDTSPIQLGDRVWWDGGVGIGYVSAIAEDASTMAAQGWTEPGIIIALAADALVRPPLIGYPARAFEEDGIGRPSLEEDRDIKAALDAAAARLDLRSTGCLGLFCTYVDHRRTSWQVLDYRLEAVTAYRLSVDLTDFTTIPAREINGLHLRITGGGPADG
jgi:hypothetical protein